ncbi:PKD domain-containing protein [candidate division KSB1 bacterium]|nr:PKD domain-containing protein [candidate division KSB1 bacterium]
MILRKKILKNPLLLFCISFLLSITTAFAVDVDDLQIIPKYVLDTDGYNADVALNPVDKSVHVCWVKDGDLYYAYRTTNGSWSFTEKIPDGGITLFGVEDRYSDGTTIQGTCAAMTVTENGEVCFAYTEEAGNVYFVKGSSGNWSAPVKISTSSSVKTNFDMIEANGSIYVTYEEGAADYQYMCSYINGSWGTPKNLGRGETTYLTKNNTGTIYFLGRSRDAVRNARFGYFQAGESTVNFVSGATDAVTRMGHGPNLAVGNGNLYLAWSDVLELDNTHKTALYCATAAEPGLSWNTKLGGDEPLYWENTGAPFSYVEVFKDGTVLYLNGRRASRRFMIWDGKNWSKTRQAPWESGQPNVASDGTTIWVAVAELPGTEVSVTGISLPGTEDLGSFDILNKNVFDSGGFSGDIALNPVNGALHAAWVHNGDLRFRVKNTDGDWGAAETIPDNNIKVYGEDQYGYPQKCISLDVDESGLTHIVFTDDNGDVYYIKGNPESWDAPVLIEDSGPLTLYPDIITCDENVTIAYQDVTNSEIKTAEYKNNAWQPAGLLEQGTFPSLYRGENGMIYILYQEHGGNRNAKFAWKVPGFTEWNYRTNVTDAADEVGDSPALSVGNGRIYLAWNNNTETSGDYKSQIYCAAADEPGLTWTGKLGQTEPIYYENTSAPLLRTAVYSDGKVILLNGRRRSPRFTIWDGSAWSLAFSAPWDEGHPQVVCDGRTTWAIVSDISTESGQVSVSGVRNLDAQKIDFANASPAIISVPDTNTVANSLWSYQCVATDDGINPPVYSLILFPEGMTINAASGLIEWTPDTEQMDDNNWGKGKGVFLVGVKAADEKGAYAAQYFWLYIRGSNHAPHITSTPVTEAFIDSLYSYQVTAEDEDGDTLKYYIDQGPAGMSIDSLSGLVTWTPVDGQAGDHDIIVSVKDGKTGTDSQNFTVTVIKIYTAPEALFSADTTSGLVPLTVQFTDLSTGDITEWEWDFGDSTSSTLQNPVHTYTQAGSYTVKLTVAGPAGHSTLSRENYIQVYSADLVPDFSANPLSGTVPLTVQFTDSSTGDITTWTWDFGDSTTSNLQNPEHIYTKAGVYSVNLTITGLPGTRSLTKENYITVLPPAPVAEFTATPLAGIVPLTVKFTDASSGNINSWFWDFGDSTTSNEQNPEHVFHVAGTYTVSLAVTGDGGSDTLKITDYIKAENPMGIESTELLPTDYNLNQNYPNPFNAQTTIEYQLPKYSNVLVSIYDINGKLINILHEGRQEAGSYKLNWDGTDYTGKTSASGLYIIQMRAGHFSDNKKVILLK